MGTLYTNARFQDLSGAREEEDDDYENSTPPYKDLPPKPGSMAPPRPPRAEKRMKIPSIRCKPQKTAGLSLTPVSGISSQLGVEVEAYPSQPPPSTTPVTCLSQKPGGPSRWWEDRLMMLLCLLVVISLLLGCISLAVTLINYRAVMEELKMLTLQQMAWQANLTGVVSLAGLKKDIDRLKSDTNKSLVELRGLLDYTKITCPKGWLPFEGRCYYFSEITKSWDEARKFCQENYSHLVIINSSAEENFVAKAHGSPRVYWLGLTDKDHEGTWKWLDGSPVTLSFWGPEEPNNSNEEDCASMNKDGTWNDLACSKTTYWICERKCSC